MLSIQNYYEVTNLDLEKNYSKLENGEGYVVTEPFPAAALHLKESAKFVALLNFIENTPRGNHYHNNKTEYLVVLSGKLKCELALAEDKNQKTTLNLTAGQTIKISPKCIHVYTSIGGDTLALEYSGQKYEAKDVIQA